MYAEGKLHNIFYKYIFPLVILFLDLFSLQEYRTPTWNVPISNKNYFLKKKLK